VLFFFVLRLPRYVPFFCILSSLALIIFFAYFLSGFIFPFAWLAQQTINHRPGNLCAVTGAKREVILGGVYQA
jgi:hypothetical protein